MSWLPTYESLLARRKLGTYGTPEPGDEAAAQARRMREAMGHELVELGTYLEHKITGRAMSVSSTRLKQRARRIFKRL